MVALAHAGIARPEPTRVWQKLVCAHCGLPVPPARVQAGEPEQFCCDGCSSVFAILHAAGLSDYYRYQSSSERHAQRGATRAEESSKSSTIAAFQAEHCPPAR